MLLTSWLSSFQSFLSGKSSKPGKKKRRDHSVKLETEHLEDRALLADTTTAIVSSGILTITDTDGVGINNRFTFSKLNPTTYQLSDASGATIDVSSIGGATNTGTATVTIPAAAFSSVQIDGAAGDDTLTLDYSGNDFGASPAFAITFNGGAGGNDSLVTIGGSYTTLTSTFTTANDGDISLADGSGTRVIHYTGLEPITIGGTVANAVINLPGTASNAVLEDDGTANNGVIRIRSANGTFETTTFSTPSSSLAIHAGTIADTLNVTVPATDFDATLAIGVLGTPVHGVTLTSDVTVGLGKDVVIYADTLTVTGLITVGGTFRATGATANLNNDISAGTLTGSVASVFVNNSTAEIQDGVSIAAFAGSTITVAGGVNNQPVTLNGSKTLALAGSVVLSTFSGTSSNTIDLGAAGNILTLNDLDSSGFDGTIIGDGDLKLDEAFATFILGGDNTYTGSTTLVQPDSYLVINNFSGSATGTGPVSIFGTLYAGGSPFAEIDGNVTIQNGAHLSSINPLRIGPAVPIVPIVLSFAATSTFDAPIDDPVNSIPIIVNGDVSITAGAVLQFTSLTAAPPVFPVYSDTFLTLFDIRNGAGPATGTFILKDGVNTVAGTDGVAIDHFLGAVDLAAQYHTTFNLTTTSLTGGNDIVVSFLPTTMVSIDGNGNLFIEDVRGTKNSLDNLTISYVTDEASAIPSPYYLIQDPFLLVGTNISGASSPTILAPYVKVPANLVALATTTKVVVWTHDGGDNVTFLVTADDTLAVAPAVPTAFPLGLEVDTAGDDIAGDIDTVSINCNVSSLAAGVSVTAAETIYLGGNLSATSGNIDLDSAGGGTVYLTTNVSLTTTLSTGNVTIGVPINADDSSANDRTLSISALVGTVNLKDTVGTGIFGELADLDVLGGLIRLGGDVTVNDGSGGQTVTLTGPVRLDNSITVITDGANDNNVDFVNAINADVTTNNRTLTTSVGTGTARFESTVGATNPLADFDVNAVGGLIRFGGNITATAGIARTLTIDGPVQLDANVAVNTDGTNDGNIDFTGTVNGAHNLTLTAASGGILFLSAVGGGVRLGAVSVVSAHDVTAIDITATSLNQSAGTGTTTLNGSINTNGAAGVTMSGTDLAVNADITTTGAGVVTFNESSIITLIGAGDINSDGAVSMTATGGIYTAGDVATSNDNVTFVSAVTLTNSISVNTGTGAGNIAFNSIVEGTTSDTEDLTLTAGTGNVTFSSAVGAGTRLGDISVVSATNVTAVAITAATLTQVAGTGTTTLNGAINTNQAGGVALTGTNLAVNAGITTTGTGGVTFVESGTVTIGSTGHISSDGAVSITGTGGISTAGDVLTTSDPITYVSAVTLTGNVVLNNTASGNITFSSTLNDDASGGSNRNLTVNAHAGDLSFVGAVGASRPLQTITVNTANNVTFTSTVATSSTLTQVTGSGTTTFNGGTIGGNLSVTTDVINVNTSTLTTNSNTLGGSSLNAQNAITLNAAVNGTASTLTFLANQNNLGSEGFTQNAGGSVSTTNDTTTAVTISVGGSGDAAIRAINTGTTAVTGGRVTITAGAAITDADGNGTMNITSGNAVLTAATGIGTSANPIETTLSNLEASGGSGGVFITNTGNLAIGGLSGVDGVSATGNNIAVTTAGSMTVNEPVANTGTGNITLTASLTSLNLNANVTASGGNGNITLNAATDILQNVGSVAAAGSGAVDYNASTLGVSGVLTMATGTQATSGSGLITMDAIGDISLQLVTTGGSIVVTSSNGNVTANDVAATANDIDGGTGVTFNLQGNDKLLTIAAVANVNSGSGGVTASADKMNLAGSITSAGQTVTLQTGNSGTSTDAIKLGSGTDAAANTLELSDAELDRITANKLVIGSNSAGAITFSDDINLSDGPIIPTLRLNTNSTVTGTSGGIVVGNLAINAHGAVNFTDDTTNVTNLAIKTTTGNINFVEANGLKVADVDGLSGVDTDSGSVTLTLTLGNLTVNDTGVSNDIDATALITLNLLADEALLTITSGADVETTAGGITASADKMDLVGTVTASTQTVTLQTGSNGTSNDAIDLGSGADTTVNTLELSDTELDHITANKLVIGTGTAGAITVSQDITLTDPPAIPTLRLNTGSTVTGTAGGLIVSNLAINAAGIVNFTSSATNVDNLAIQTTTGNITFTEANTLNVATVDGLDGVHTGNGNVAINVTTGNLVVLNTGATNDVDATTGIILTLSGNDAVFTVSGGADVETNGNNLTNDIIVNADEMVLSGTITAAGSNQIVTLRNNTLNKQIYLGTNPGTAGILELSDAELDNVSAGNVLRIGRNDAAATANITFTAPITAPAGWSTLHLINNAAIVDDNAANPDITVANLAIESVSGIAAAGTDAVNGLEVLLTNLAFNNSGTGSVAFTEGVGGGGIVVNSVDGLTSSSNAGTTTTITANGPVAFAVDTTSAGTLTANAIETNTPAVDNVSVNATVTVRSTGGNVIFNAGDQILVNGTGTVIANTGNIVLTSGVADTDTNGSQTLDGTIQANNSSTTRVTIDLQADAGSASQAGTGKILAGQLRLLSTTNGGLFALATSILNDVDTIAASTDGTIAFRDLDDLIVGTATTVGITTTSDDVQLFTGGTLLIDDDINLVNGDLGLNAGAAVTQNSGDDITANGLALTNVGPFTLTNVGNNVATIAANSANIINYVDANTLSVGSVTVLAIPTTGITTSDDDVTLKTQAGNITINNTVNLGLPATGGDLELILNDGTSALVSQAVGANVLGHGLALLSTGTGSYQYTLDNVGNNVANIAADFRTGAVAFALRYQDADDLHVNVVTGLTGTTTGIQTGSHNTVNGGGVRLRAGQTDADGQLFVDNDIDTRAGTGGNLTISGGVQFTTGSTFNGQGDIDLGGGANYPDILVNVPTTHTMTGGTVTYRPDRDIIVSSTLAVNNGHLVLDADGEGSAVAQTIAQTAAMLSPGNDDGGVWIRAVGTVNVQPGVNGGGSLVIAGSDIHNDPIGGPFSPDPVDDAGIQIDSTTAGTEVIADGSIGILVKTRGAGGEDDLQIDGDISSDHTGPINVQVEDTLTQNGTVQVTTAGTITYDAEDMILNTTTAVIDARPTGVVWLRNRTLGHQIDVGTDTVGRLGLTDAELDRIAQASVIRIGRRDAQRSGNVNVTAGPITPLNNDTLHLISGADIVDTSAGFIVITNLALEASDDIRLDTGSNDSTANDHDVAVLAMATYNAGGDATYVSRTNFTVGTVDGVVGINVQATTSLTSGIEAALSGDVIQTSPVITNSLQLLGQGNYTFDLSTNDVNVLSGTVLNSIILTDVDDITVDTITSVQGTTSGTSSSSITLTAPTVIVNRPIVTTSELGFVILDVTTLLDINGIIGNPTFDPIINSKGFVQQTGTGSVQLEGQIITTDDNVYFNGPVTIGTTANTTARIDTGSIGGGNITFNSTVRGTTGSATPTFENLTLNAGTGDILFNGQVGGAGFRLGVVTIQTARHVTTNVGFSAREISQLTGTGETRFNGFVQTNQPNGIDITSNYITFNGSIQTTNNGKVRINNASDFQIVAGSGAINADGPVTQTGAGLNLIGGDIATTDDVITFATDTYISNTAVLMNSGLGDVSFAKLLQVNNKTLTIRDGNTVDLGTRTTIANGTLNVFVGNAPSVTKGTLNLGSGELFTGAGTVNANMSVGTGATLAPASATTLVNSGILTVNGNVNLASGAVYAVDLNSAVAGTGYDQLIIPSGSAMNITAGAVLQATRNGSFSPAVGTVLTILDGVNAVTGSFTGATNGTTLFLNGAYFTINYNTPSGDVTLTSANPPGGAAKIIDNDEASGSQYSAASNNGTLTFSPSNAWTLNTVAGRGFTNDLRFAPGAASETATATYTFNGLTMGGTYRVSITWFDLSNRASNAPFTLSGGASSPTFTVNQRNAPVGFNSNGATWQDLSTAYTITGTTLTVKLGNNANGYVIADAVRIEAVTSAGPEIQVVNTTDANANINSGSGTVNFGTTTQGGTDVTKMITITNTGLTPLILGSATLTAPAGFSISNYAPTSLAPGASLPLTVKLLATTAGNYSGTISIQTNDLDENPFTFNVVGSVVSTSVWIVDNDPNTTTPTDLVVGQAPVTGSYSETGTWVNNTDPNVGYLQDLRFATPGAAATASWTFSGLSAGTYRVSVTYRAEPNRASNASFTVTDGTTPVTVNVNERNQPGSFQSATVYWQDLVAAYGSVTSGTITVTLNAAGTDGYVIADAVRLERVGPLVAASGPAPLPVTTALTQTELSSISAAAITRWQQAGLTDIQLAALKAIHFQIQDLPGGQISGETEATIFIDPTAAGYGWYIDPTPTDDTEFNVNVTATEKTTTNPAISPRMDLLTVLMHELGHRLGLDDVPTTANSHGLMTDVINTGTRRLPTAGLLQSTTGQASGTGSSTTPPTTTPPTTTPPVTTPPTTPKALTPAEIKAAAAAAKAAAAKAAAEKAAAAKAAAAKAAAEKAAAAKAAAAKAAAEKAAAKAAAKANKKK